MSNNKLHVLIIPEFLPFQQKGWGGFTWNYINSVSPHCRVTIFHSRLDGEEAGLKEHYINENTRLIRYFPYENKPGGIKKSTAYLKWFKDCMKILKRLDEVDVIHAHGAVLNGTLARKLSKEWNIPYVLTEHTGPFSKVVEDSFKQFWVKKIMESADAVLAVSNHLKNEILESKIQPKKIIVTHNPVNTDLFKPKTGSGFKNIVFAGRLDENKGGLTAVKAFHKVLPELEGWTLTICGDGREMEPIMQYVRENQLEDKVIIKGLLSEEEVADAFSKADGFISPTLYESFGMSIAEAMATGLPVLTTNRTAPQEYVDESSGILVDTSDVDEVAKGLAKLINQLNQYDAGSIRNKVVEQFSVSNFGERMYSIYKSL